MKNFFITLGIVLSIIAIIVGGGYLFVRHTIHIHTYRPLDSSVTHEDAVTFEIEPGMWPAAVVERLYEEDLIRNRFIANQIIRFNEWGALQVGEYEIHQGMSLNEMFELFTEHHEGESFVCGETHACIIIPEGELITGIANRFAAELEWDADEFLGLWSDVDFLTELIDEYWFLTDEILNPDILYPLEGYFYPIRHDIPVEIEDLREVTRRMLNMTQYQLSGVRMQIEDHEMTFHEILAFAAVIEAETQDEDEKGTVAGVFQNRIDIDMLLQTDVTVQYVAPERSFHVTPEMLAIESPFNTYLNLGLPPGPVNSPSTHAILAAMSPESHDYLFFISDMFGCIDHGKHYFTNFDDHYAFYLEHLQPSYNAGESLCDPDVQVN